MNAKEIHKEPALIRLSHELVTLSLRAGVEIATAAPFSRRIGIDDRRRTHKDVLSGQQASDARF
jgi:hypothetical protein